jgi:hypothetical protein
MLFTWCSISICLRIKCHFVSISHKQTRDNKTISSLLISAMAPNILPTTPIHTCSHRRCKVRHLNGIMVSWLPVWSRFLPNSDGEKRENIPKWHDLEPTSYGHGCAPAPFTHGSGLPGVVGKIPRLLAFLHLSHSPEPPAPSSSILCRCLLCLLVWALPSLG